MGIRRSAVDLPFLLKTDNRADGTAVQRHSAVIRYGSTIPGEGVSTVQRTARVEILYGSAFRAPYKSTVLAVGKLLKIIAGKALYDDQRRNGWLSTYR